MVRAGQLDQLHDFHPIFEELLFVPFTYFSFRVAYLLWTFLNVVLTALTLVIVKKTFSEVGGLGWPLMFLMVTGFAPAVRALMQGQDSILLLFLVMLGVSLLMKRKDVWAGAALGAGLFKFHIVIPLALVLAVRRPRLLAGLACVAALLVAISVATLGWGGVFEYVRVVLQMEGHGAGGTPATAMPNLRGLTAELFRGSGAGAANVATIVASIVVLGIVLWRVGRADTPLRYAFAVASVTGMMVSYHAVIHDLTLVLPLVLVLFSAGETTTPSEMWIDIGLLFLIYTGLFGGSSHWSWLNPWWWIPIVFWIIRKYGWDHEKRLAV
jgi:Glycosyltransferase family 87